MEARGFSGEVQSVYTNISIKNGYMCESIKLQFCGSAYARHCFFNIWRNVEMILRKTQFTAYKLIERGM